MKSLLDFISCVFIVAVIYVLYTHGAEWTEAVGLKGVLQETVQTIKNDHTIHDLWCGKKGC